MPERHITRELLQALTEGTLPPGHLAEAGFEHLLAVCPRCREEVEAWRQENSGAAADYGQAFDRLRGEIAALGDRGTAVMQEAREDLRRLLTLPPEEREGKVRRARSRFRNPALVELLLERSLSCLPQDPRGSEHFAELAGAVLAQVPAREGEVDSLVRAAALKANARRVLGEPKRAGELFAHARDLQQHHGIADPLVAAELDSLEASLAIDMRRLTAAERLLRRAVSRYRAVDDDPLRGLTLVKLGNVYREQGEVAKALATVEEALTLLDREEDPHLYLSAWHNAAFYLCDLGQHRQARALVEAHRELYARFPDRTTQLRLSWVEGRIAHGLGDLPGAEAALRATRDGFVEESSVYDAAMVSLDLALVLLAAGQLDEIKVLASQLVAFFEVESIQREAWASLVLLERAARLEELTAEHIGQMMDFLRQIRGKLSPYRTRVA